MLVIKNMCTHIYIYTYICICPCIALYLCMYTLLPMYICMYTYTHTYIRTYIHAYAHAYIHAYIQTSVQLYPGNPRPCISWTHQSTQNSKDSVRVLRTTWTLIFLMFLPLLQEHMMATSFTAQHSEPPARQS